MSYLSRRQFLSFFGAGTATVTFGPSLIACSHLSKNSAVSSRTSSSIVGGSVGSLVARGSTAGFTPVRMPHPLPIYQSKGSFMPLGLNGAGETLEAVSDPSLPRYTVVDDVVVPPEYERYVIVSWGDRVFPNEHDYFGYNNDYTGFVPIDSSENDGYLWVNHEYVSYPFAEFTTNDEALIAAGSSFEKVIGFALPQQITLETLGEAAYNMGGSIVRIQRENADSQFQVVKDEKNRRYHLLSGLKINGEQQRPVRWGDRPHQQGDDNYLVGTGPAATDVFPKSEDGHGNQIIGTAFNCSGGTTPWGSILTAEENFQGMVQENVKPDGTQVAYQGVPSQFFGLVGEKYGWMVEMDLANPEVRGKKHTALGRFRHENITFRLQPGQPLIAYMGDDRRGGHTWKYVSDGTLRNLSDSQNSSLFEAGTLYVAKYNADGTGKWLALTLNAPTNPNKPSEICSIELAALKTAQKDGRVQLPKRKGVAGETEDGGSIIVDLTNETEKLKDYQGKTLKDFYANPGAVLVDAFLAANLIGGTPSSRPEDLEVHPQTGEVFIAYTDNIAGSDGYPDSRIFQTAKLDAKVNAQQPSGGIYKIIEGSANGAGTTFTWEKFKQAGEAGAENGAGFANVDNLLFDGEGNLWAVTDMSTSRQNGFKTGTQPEERKIDHRETGSVDKLVGVFGNNWIFHVPMAGEDAGQVLPFGYGPMRCEVTGPTLIGNTLIAAVQHPGEDVPIGAGQPPLSRKIQLLSLEGEVFTQTRTVPLGSNWPSNIGHPLPDGTVDLKGPPRPSVIGIRPKTSEVIDS